MFSTKLVASLLVLVASVTIAAAGGTVEDGAVYSALLRRHSLDHEQLLSDALFVRRALSLDPADQGGLSDLMATAGQSHSVLGGRDRHKRSRAKREPLFGLGGDESSGVQGLAASGSHPGLAAVMGSG